MPTENRPYAKEQQVALASHTHLESLSMELIGTAEQWAAVAAVVTAGATVVLAVGAIIAARFALLNAQALVVQLQQSQRAFEASVVPILDIDSAVRRQPTVVEISVQNIGPGVAVDVDMCVWALPLRADDPMRAEAINHSDAFKEAAMKTGESSRTGRSRLGPGNKVWHRKALQEPIDYAAYVLVKFLDIYQQEFFTTDVLEIAAPSNAADTTESAPISEAGRATAIHRTAHHGEDELRAQRPV